MINNDRIVPVQATDLVSLYAVILAQDSNNSSLAKKAADNAEGDFTVVSTDGSLLLADEPAKSIDFATGYSSGAIYFVPAYSFTGFKVAGVDVVATGTVKADGCSLYKATLSTGAVSVEKIGL